MIIGIGECDPDSGCRDKVRMCGGKCTPCPEDNDEDIFYPCSGCELEDKCYRDFGIQTNNRALCEKIIEEQAKQKCIDNTF